MATTTATSTPTLIPAASTPPPSALFVWARGVGRGLRLALIVGAAMLTLALLLQLVLAPALAALQVEETFTSTLATLLVALLPIAAYLCGGVAARRERQGAFVLALLSAWTVALLGWAALTGYQAVTGSGAFQQMPTLGFTYEQGDAGVVITSLDAGGAGETAGLQVGDIITAVRRDPVTADALRTRITQAQPDEVFRLRIVRDGEELQLPITSQLIVGRDDAVLLRGLGLALLVAFITLVLPSRWVPHLLLLGMLLPLFVGYLWLIIATFSQRTHGLLPVDAAGRIGGWTLENWQFLSGTDIGGPSVNIWRVTLNSLAVAIAMTVSALAISSMAGYALSRMMFPGRRLFLSMTLILHGFPAVTLIIPVFLVLLNIGSLPIIGRFIGYNSAGGVALVMIAFELPLGIWLMKGFFDAISWDMERSALIDGASRWRTFWEIILPQIRPGLLALGIFSFISGWNAYLLPATYSVGTGLATLPVYIQQLAGELTPVNWNQVAAVGLFQLIPIFLFFIFAQEYLLNIYAGGTKGSS